MQTSRNISRNNQLTLISGDNDNVNSDNITLQPSTVEPSSLFLYEPSTGRGMRSRRNTFTYGQAGEGSSTQFPTLHDSSALSPFQSGVDSHYELVPYSKDWTVIL